MSPAPLAASGAFDLLCAQHTFVVLDVETCPSEDGYRVVSIAAVTCRNGRQRSTWTTNIDPGVPITNSWIHGLTDDDVVGAPTFADVTDQLEQQLSAPDVVLVCHNARFDERPAPPRVPAPRHRRGPP